MGDGKHMQLQHAGDVGSQECQIAGPFDVVLMDMTLSHLLHALLQVRAHALDDPYKVSRVYGAQTQPPGTTAVVGPSATASANATSSREGCTGFRAKRASYKSNNLSLSP